MSSPSPQTGRPGSRRLVLAVVVPFAAVLVAVGYGAAAPLRAAVIAGPTDGPRDRAASGPRSDDTSTTRGAYEAEARARRFAAAYERPGDVPHPADNAPTAARLELGKALFFDPRLSGSRAISCATCHNPSFAWGDGNPRAVGHGSRELDRRTPTILNLAWSEALFWDGRAETLEEQALGPIEAPGEMNLSLDAMTARLREIPGYAPMFRAAYPGEPLSPAAVARAIAAFERTVVSGEAPFDRWRDGDERAISDEAKAGFALFNAKANCASCHGGWRFTDDSFHDIGVAGTDIGRAAVVDIESVRHAFKTPTLRNAVERAPYMHDGSERTLEDVIELYDLGGRVARPSRSPEIRPLGLTAAEKQALVAFLRTLSSVDAPVTIPVLPH